MRNLNEAERSERRLAKCPLKWSFQQKTKRNQGQLAGQYYKMRNTSQILNQVQNDG